MSKRDINRVVFHSTEDLSAGYNLRKAEELLNSLNISDVSEVNDLLEIYNIKLYFDNDIFLLTWDETTKNKFNAQISQAWVIIKDFYLAISEQNILSVIENLEFNYKESFWHLFNYFQVYKRINNDTFVLILKNHPRQVSYILSHLNTVNHFDTELRRFLISYDKSAELLLARFEEADRFKEVAYIFPKSLSLTDKETIISGYIDHDEANLNYIRLIEHSKESNDLKLSAKTRLKAKKRSEELNKKILEEGVSWKVGVQITLDKDQEEPVKVTNDGPRLEISYSEKLLDQQPDDVALFMLFRNLFGFTDQNGLITLVNKKSEMDVLERTFMKSKNEYSTGMAFQRKNQLAFLQVVVFNHYLSQKNRSIEELIQSFIKLALNEHFKLESLQLKFPTKNSTFLERIRILAPELEFLLKQYQVYSTEGKIDFELIEIDSSPLKFGDVKSLLGKKNAYIKDDKALILKHHFSSDQSMLHYIEPFKEKYSNLYDLLQNEDVKLDNFRDYQKDLIGKLVSEDYLIVDSDDNVRIKNDILIYLIGDLHRNEVISYWHFPKEVQEVLDKMERENFIRFENTLFSEHEINFYNYYLNKKGYTNGLNIRNKYLHGSNSGSEKEHEIEYYILLTLVILALLKITDDLMLQKNMKFLATNKENIK
jgi:hypothetical protein